MSGEALRSDNVRRQNIMVKQGVATPGIYEFFSRRALTSRVSTGEAGFEHPPDNFIGNRRVPVNEPVAERYDPR